MEDYMLRQQQGSEVLKVIMPIWKTHTLRWLFYRKVPNIIMSTDKWGHADRCKLCKKGVNARIVFSMRRDDGTWKTVSQCPRCGKDYEAEPNTNLSHKLWKSYKEITNPFWLILDKIHLVRSTTDGRYGMMGDESRYIKSTEFDKDWNFVKTHLKRRKWWEYILIEKPIHNF